MHTNYEIMILEGMTNTEIVDILDIPISSLLSDYINTHFDVENIGEAIIKWKTYKKESLKKQ